MRFLFPRLRLACLASTAAGFTAVAAYAQTVSNPPSALNLGNVVATAGSQKGGGPAAASATGSLRQAHKLVRLAPNVISVQPLSQMQKYPDVNIAESLQRVPGIQLETDTGEGRFINIRGLDADLNGTTFDGVHLTASNQSTPTGGGRAVAFDAFPEGLIGGVEVVKSLTPDMEAEGLGGNINLLPLTLPPGGGVLANFSAAGGEELLRNTGIYSGSAAVGGSFAVPGMRSFANTKPFSLILNYTNYTDRRDFDDVEEDYNSATEGNLPASLQDLQFRRYNGHRVRQGFGGELDFDPSPQNHFYVIALQGGYDEQLDKNRLEIDGLDGSGTDEFGNPGTLTDDGGANYTATGATSQKRFTNSNERIGNDLIVLGGKTVLADIATVDFRGSWTEGYDIVPRSYSTTFQNNTPFTINYSTASSEYRTYNIPSGIDLADPTLYTLNNVSNTPGRNFDQEFNAAADVSVPTSVLGTLGVVKFGAEARFRAEGSFQLEYDYNNLDTNATLADLSGGNPPEVYYNSHYAIGPDVAYNSLYNVLGAPTQNQATTIGSFAHNTEKVYAGYGQDTIELGPLEVLAGARVEDTNGTYRAFATTNEPDGSTVFTPNTNRQDYINVFPSVQLKYTLNNALQFRATYSTGIARPGFDQITAAQTVTIGGASNGQNAVMEGNPNLKPTTGNSFDLTAEYYTPSDGLILINPFYKLFNNYVVATQTEGVYQGAPAQINSFENIGGAFARGLEIDGEQKFFFLPHPLDGFGIDANITFVDSRGHYDVGEKANVLPETSPLSYNASLFYEEGPVNFRLAAAYVSRNLFTVVGSRATDQFSTPRLRLDVSGSIQATPRIQFYVEGKNLTNTLLEFTQSASSASDPARVLRRRVSGRGPLQPWHRRRRRRHQYRRFRR